MGLFGHWGFRDLNRFPPGPPSSPRVRRGPKLNASDLTDVSARSVIVVLSGLLTCRARYGMRRAHNAPCADRRSRLF